MTPSDQEAQPTFEEFVTTHGPELVAFAARLAMDHHRGEDIVQDVLARVGLSWPRISRMDNVRAYVFKSVLHDFLSWRRRLSSSEYPAADLGGHRRDDGTPGIDDAVVGRDRVRVALARLSAAQRAVVVLRYYHDLPDAEIAALMSCRESTVRSHARRALAALRLPLSDNTSTRGSSEGVRR